MAQKKDFISVEGSAFLVASAGNLQDFQDAKAFFKEEIRKAEENATSDTEKLKLYKGAISGFLLQLQPLSESTDFIKLAQQIKVLIKQCQDLSKLACGLGLWATMMTGMTILCLIKLFF